MTSQHPRTLSLFKYPKTCLYQKCLDNCLDLILAPLRVRKVCIVYTMRMPMNKYAYNPYPSNSLGFKEKDSAFLGQSVKICIRGQFFVLNKTRRGTRLIFLVYPFQKRVFLPKKHFEMALTPNQLTDDCKILGEEKYAFFLLACKISAKSVQ